MPAPATSSRHLYTGHRRGHIQAAPRLRAHRSEPLSQDHPQIPVSMPSLFRFDASAVVHTCSSSHRTPAPLTARRQPQRSPPRLLTDAACGGLESPPARRPRRTYLHHWHSTDRADDLLHHHHFPSGHTWVPTIRSWALTRGFALHPGPGIGTRFGTRGLSIGPHRGRSTTTAEFPAPTGNDEELTAIFGLLAGLGVVSAIPGTIVFHKCKRPEDNSKLSSRPTPPGRPSGPSSSKRPEDNLDISSRPRW